MKASCLAFSSLLLCVTLFAIGADRPPTPEEAINKVVTDFDVNGTLQQALERCEQVAGVRLHVDWNLLKAAGVTPTTKVTVKAPQAKVSQLLSAVLAKAAGDYPLAWYIRDDAIRVSTQAHALGRDGKDVAAQARKPSDAAPASQPAPPAAVKNLDFDAAPLSLVLGFLHDLAGNINFDINWEAMREVGVTKETPITVKASNITLARALELVTEKASGTRNRLESIYWMVDDGIVLITTGAVLDSKTRVRIFEVGDLLVSVPDFKAPRMDIGQMMTNADGGSSGAGSSRGSGGLFVAGTNTPEDQSVDASKKAAQESLAATIKGTIGEDMWAPQGKGTIKFIGSRMVISQTLLGYKLMEKGANLK